MDELELEKAPSGPEMPEAQPQEIPKTPEQMREERLQELESRITDLAPRVKNPEELASFQSQLENDCRAQITDIEGRLDQSLNDESVQMIEHNLVEDHVNRADADRSKLDALTRQKAELLNENAPADQPPGNEALGAEKKEPAAAKAPKKMEDDERFRSILEAKSLEHLKTKDAKWFSQNFSGKLSPSGYLLDKQGQETNFLPSQNISAGFDEITAAATAEFKTRYAETPRAESEKIAEVAAEAPVGEQIAEEPVARQEALQELKVSYEIQRAKKPIDVENRVTLSAEAYLPAQDAGDLTNGSGTDLGFHSVENDKIVGSVSLAFDNWGSEYESRSGRVEGVAKELAAGSDAGLEQVFHAEDPNQRIKLKEIAGPDGPLFIVKDGTHRVAATKLAEMPRVLAQIESASTPDHLTTKDRLKADDWQKMIDQGIIDGKVAEKPDGSFELNVDKQVLPWAGLDRNSLIKVSKIYKQKYPGALQNLKNLKTGKDLPKEIFLDETKVALNFYLAGRWAEYQQQKSKMGS